MCIFLLILLPYPSLGSTHEVCGDAGQYCDVLDYIYKLRHQIFMSATVLAIILRLRRKQVDWDDI